MREGGDAVPQLPVFPLPSHTLNWKRLSSNPA